MKNGEKESNDGLFLIIDFDIEINLSIQSLY